MITDVENQILLRSIPEPNTGCWLWLRAMNKGDHDLWSYGVWAENRNRNMLAHRRVYEITHGPIPVGMIVMHKCDQPSCVNPEHLILGTAKTNTQDMWRKGRGPVFDRKGEANGRSVLTEKMVLEIRAAPTSITTASLARKFAASESCVRLARSRKTWIHLP